MLCSFSAGEGGDCKRNLKKKDFQEFYFLHLPANLSDILGGGGLVLDTVAPEMASRELLPSSSSGRSSGSSSSSSSIIQK